MERSRVGLPFFFLFLFSWGRCILHPVLVYFYFHLLLLFGVVYVRQGPGAFGTGMGRVCENNQVRGGVGGGEKAGQGSRP